LEFKCLFFQSLTEFYLLPPIPTMNHWGAGDCSSEHLPRKFRFASCSQPTATTIRGHSDFGSDGGKLVRVNEFAGANEDSRKQFRRSRRSVVHRKAPDFLIFPIRALLRF